MSNNSNLSRLDAKIDQLQRSVNKMHKDLGDRLDADLGDKLDEFLRKIYSEQSHK
jgi:hypothetical protein